MTALRGLSPAGLSRIPPVMQHMVLRRAEWSLCAMEHSRIDAVHADDPGAAFHHIALTLGAAPPKMGIHAEGRRYLASGSPGNISMIEAGVAGTTWWDDGFEAACFYFTSESLAVALGADIDNHRHRIRTNASLDAPVARLLLQGLLHDATSGQPHGLIVGDAIFVALAGVLAPTGLDWRASTRPGMSDWRTRRALEYIHTHLTDPLDVTSIAAAAGTSPFHLSRQFRVALGIPIWRYVLRERARHAFVLLQTSRLTLLEISVAAGFQTYASFISVIRSEFGQSPLKLRNLLTSSTSAFVLS